MKIVLAETLRRNPRDRKTRALLRMLQLDTSSARALVRTWHLVHGFHKRLHTAGSSTAALAWQRLLPAR